MAPQFPPSAHRQTRGIVPGRDRPRSDRGRHAHERARQRQGQHLPRRARPGSTGGTATRASAPRAPKAAGRVQVRRGRHRATRRCARRSSTTSSFLAQASTESQGPWDSNYQVEDNFSWFLPGKKGDHDLKFGARYNYTELRRVSQINMNGTFRFNTDLPFDAGQSAAPIPSASPSAPDAYDETINEPHLRVLRAGQVADRAQHDAEPRPALRPRALPARRDRQSAVRRRQKTIRSTRTTSARASASPARSTPSGKSVIRGRLRDLLQPHDPRRARRHASSSRSSRTRSSLNFPNDTADPGPSARPVSDRSVPGQRPVREPGAAQRSCTRRARRCATPAS